MAKMIAFTWNRADLEKFPDADIHAEIERCRTRLDLASTAYQRKSFAARIRELEKIVARRASWAAEETIGSRQPTP